jgi:hypothetical protein
VTMSPTTFVEINAHSVGVQKPTNYLQVLEC